MKICPKCESGHPDACKTCPTHGAMLTQPRDLPDGLLVRGAYRIVRKLGEGGMGAVYLATQTFMNEPVAMKFLSADLSQDTSFTNRFLREAKTLRSLRHPNIVDASYLEQAEDESLFFTMEFVDGPDLEALIQKRAPLPIAEALAIARGVAEGLAVAHAKGLVHRDIKPQNVLMARDGDSWMPKIADFGIVTSKEGSQLYTRTRGTLLTMAYAAARDRFMKACDAGEMKGCNYFGYLYAQGVGGAKDEAAAKATYAKAWRTAARWRRLCRRRNVCGAAFWGGGESSAPSLLDSIKTSDWTLPPAVGKLRIMQAGARVRNGLECWPSGAGVVIASQPRGPRHRPTARRLSLRARIAGARRRKRTHRV